jgi:hypothetical protein
LSSLAARLGAIERIVYANDDGWCTCKNVAIHVVYPEQPSLNHSDSGPCHRCGRKRREVVIHVICDDLPQEVSEDLIEPDNL